MAKLKVVITPQKKVRKAKPKSPPLFQAHDKFFKIAFQDKENAIDFLKMYFLCQFPDIELDWDSLHLDDAQHVSNKLHHLYSDVVYRCKLKGDRMDKIVYVSFLFEHKSKMPTTEFDMRLQLLEYIHAIKRKNKSEKRPDAIVIPIVFNQSDKSWEQQSFRSCFPDAPSSLLQFVPEFAYFVFNLVDLPDEQIRMLREYSALRGVLFAMKHYKNVDFLKNHFEEMIHFIEEHPEKEDLWQTIFAYILGNGELEQDVINSILKNIHSPKIKQKMDLATNKGIFGQAYRQGRDEEAAKWKEKLQNTENELAEAKIKAENAQNEAENAKIEAENTRIFLSLLYGWHKQADLTLIADIASISLKEAQLWIASFDYIKSNQVTQKVLSPKQWVKLLEKKKTKYFALSEAQVTRLLELLGKSVG
jgi:Putative transposase, YhgA-like